MDRQHLTLKLIDKLIVHFQEIESKFEIFDLIHLLNLFGP